MGVEKANVRQCGFNRRGVFGVRARLLGRGNEAGFALAETVVALALFLIVAVGLEATLVSSIAGHRVARERTLGAELADERVEAARAIDYNSVGTVGGNPPGTMEAIRTELVDGHSFRVTTRVTYVDDPIPGATATAANYKKVLVVVTKTGSTRELARQETYVAPAQREPYGGTNKGVIRTTIRDYVLNSGVPGALVNLSTGPSAPRADTTDSTGVSQFPALTATSGSQYYDVTTAASGYTTLREDLPNSTAAHFQLAPGELIQNVIRVYQGATIVVNLTDFTTGLPYLLPATVTIASSRGAETYSVTGGTLTRTQVAGENIVPGVSYNVSARAGTNVFSNSGATAVLVPASGYPTVLSRTFNLTLRSYSTRTLNVTVRQAASPNPVVPSARVDISRGPANTFVSGVATSGGVYTLAVPRGSTTYTVTATDPATGRTGTNSSVSVPSGTGAVNVTIYVS